jgi:hypothetical protein
MVRLYSSLPARGGARPPFFFAKPTLASKLLVFGYQLLRRWHILSSCGVACGRDGGGLLLVGASGSGKSTLAIGLIRAGWRYLSDDAVLLRHGSQGVEALACRRSFYVDARRFADYSDLSLGDEAPDSNGGRRRKVGINEFYPEQYVLRCLPRVVIFPRIKRRDQSTLKPSDSVRALGFLLAQSAPQLFDRSTMAGHLELLKALLQQTETYELDSGTDLYREPATLVDLIKEAQGRKDCRELSLN